MSTVIYNEEGRPLLFVPDWFKGQATKLLRYVNAATTSDPDVRRAICAREPLIFALVYFPHHIESEETGNRRSLNSLHIFVAENAATYWPFALKEKECRFALVAPRDSGKSTWMFLILPLWGAAYRWRIYQVFFSDSGPRAEQHLGNLRVELDENEKLRADFPDLCEPDTRRGRSLGDTKSVFRSKSGVTFMARGIDAKNLGLKEKRSRPDLIVIDDIEPITKYSKESKDQRLYTLLNGVLPSNLNAAVYVIGTVVRYGSIMHEVVLSDTGGGVASWIDQEKFATKYWPVYYIDKDTRRTTSFWPERFSIDWILSEVQNTSFQLAYMNQPVSSGAGMFSMRDLDYRLPFRIESEVLAIDPAVTSRETSDFTGIAVIGFDGAKQNGHVEYAKGVKLDPDNLRELIKLLLVMYPKIDTVVIESINGGDYIMRQLAPVIPRHIRCKTGNDYAPKAERIRDLHDWCQRRWVTIGPENHAFVDQALSYPAVDNDDIVDAVAKGCHHHLSRRPVPVAR